MLLNYRSSGKNDSMIFLKFLEKPSNLRRFRKIHQWL
jgi:hypothetical protein